jgi:hypothetical protein
MRRLMIQFLCASSLMLTACATIPLPAKPTLAPSQRSPTVISTDLPSAITCADLDGAWGAEEWAAVLGILAQLEEEGVSCGDGDMVSKRYGAYINYGEFLEGVDDHQAAIGQYELALELRLGGVEALRSLARLGSPPEPTPVACHPAELAAYPSAEVPADAFVSAEGQQLRLGEEPFFVRGLNYYPRHAPWERFLTEGELVEMEEELALIAGAGFNTLRIFLWYDPLFTCAPEEAQPNPATFAKLDAFIALARQHNFYLIVTLNDLPDLFVRPLYTDWARYDAQSAFIVQRYHNEPAILAWDLRNEGDLDYGARPNHDALFEPQIVLAWLAHSAEMIRSHDTHHLLTAGWWGEPTTSADILDILSFHHWAGANELQRRLEPLEQAQQAPILLEEVGYPSFGGEAGELTQAERLRSVIERAEQQHLAGWLIWTAFDFAHSPETPPHPEHTFGLWRTDLSAKPVVEMLRELGE